MKTFGVHVYLSVQNWRYASPRTTHCGQHIDSFWCCSLFLPCAFTLLQRSSVCSRAMRQYLLLAPDAVVVKNRIAKVTQIRQNCKRNGKKNERDLRGEWLSIRMATEKKRGVSSRQSSPTNNIFFRLWKVMITWPHVGAKLALFCRKNSRHRQKNKPGMEDSWAEYALFGSHVQWLVTFSLSFSSN